MERGEQVQLWVTFTETWSSGFEIADIVEGGYQVRRRSDGSLLPSPTSEGDLRRDDTDTEVQRGR